MEDKATIIEEPIKSNRKGKEEGSREDNTKVFFGLYYIGYVLSFFSLLTIFVLLPLFTLQEWLRDRHSQAPGLDISQGSWSSISLLELWVFIPPLIVFLGFLYIFPLVYLLLFLGTSKLFGVPRQKVRHLLEKINKSRWGKQNDFPHPEGNENKINQTIVVEITEGYMRMEKTSNINLGKRGMVARMFYTDI